MSEMFEKLKVYNIVLSSLTGCSEEACVSCICTESVLVRLKKRLEKLKKDLNELQTGEEKAKFLAKVNRMLGASEKLPIKAETKDCLMTRGICELPKCVAHNISEMLNLVKP